VWPRFPVFAQPAGHPPVPGRRALQMCLGLVWLLDAGLQFQPYMFGPFFVTQGIKLSTAGSPSVVASSVDWVSQLMLQHVALYNALFATTQLLIGCGMLFRRTLRLALAGSIAWALAVWCLVTAAMGHRNWQDPMQFSHFLKNIGLAGAFLAFGALADTTLVN